MLGSWRAFLTQVQGGRRDKLRPGDILGALTSSGSGSGLSGADVGTIEVTDQRTWVAVRSAAAAKAAAALGKTRIKKSKFKVHLVDET
jgi:ATP-independent RNA helicase DbpA